MRRNVAAGSCTHAGSGHAAAAPPISEMKATAWSWAPRCPARWPFQVDDELEFCRLHHRQIAWLLSFEDSARISSGQTEQVDSIGSIAHQTTLGCGLAILKACGHSVPDRQGGDPFTQGIEDLIGGDHEAAC